MSKRQAVFLDRDGTLVHPRHYPSRPEQLLLYAGLAAELRAVQVLGLLLVVITNQAGLARGLFSLADLEAMHTHLRSELAAQGVRIDAIYHCPHHPEGVLPELSYACECRKPQPGMLLQAAAEHQIDLQRSWFVGDILDDVEAGNRAGCRTVLVDLGSEAAPTHPLRSPEFVARDTCHALRIIRAVEIQGYAEDSSYRPQAWEKAYALTR